MRLYWPLKMTEANRTNLIDGVIFRHRRSSIRSIWCVPWTNEINLISKLNFNDWVINARLKPIKHNKKIIYFLFIYIHSYDALCLNLSNVIFIYFHLYSFLWCSALKPIKHNIYLFLSLFPFMMLGFHLSSNTIKIIYFYL